MKTVDRFLLVTALGYGAAPGRYLKLAAAWWASILLAVLVGTLGGIYPATKANRFDPAEIFRHG